jgi:hypothetical protein
LLTRFWYLVMALATAAGVAGCSSGRVNEANAYVRAVNTAQTTYSRASDQLAPLITPGASTPSSRQALARLTMVARTFAARLREIRAPNRVRGLHQRLIGAVVRLGAGLRTAQAGLTSRDAARILDGQQQLAAASVRARTSINAIISAINGALTR